MLKRTLFEGQYLNAKLRFFSGRREYIATMLVFWPVYTIVLYLFEKILFVLMIKLLLFNYVLQLQGRSRTNPNTIVCSIRLDFNETLGIDGGDSATQPVYILCKLACRRSWTHGPSRPVWAGSLLRNFRPRPRFKSCWHALC